MKRFLLFVACVGVLVVAATGCNTVRGMGRDIEKAGETIREVAE